MRAIVVRYITLVGLLLTFGWSVSVPTEWEPWTVFALTLAVYIWADAYEAIAAKEAGSERPDHKLFRKFLQDLPSDGSIAFINNANMAGFSFPADRLNDLRDFWHIWATADHEFQDKKLESLRKELSQLVGMYMRSIAVNTFPAHNSGFQTVPPEWEVENPKRFSETVEELHSLAGKVFEKHQQLVRLGRQRLGLSSIA